MSINGRHHSLIDQLKDFDRSGPPLFYRKCGNCKYDFIGTKKQTRCASCRRKEIGDSGGNMTNSGGAKQRWQELYEATSAETDREKVTELINRTEEALMARTQELAHDADDHADERNAMVQASENLLTIKTEKLSYPPIEMK